MFHVPGTSFRIEERGRCGTIYGSRLDCDPIMIWVIEGIRGDGRAPAVRVRARGGRRPSSSASRRPGGVHKAADVLQLTCPVPRRRQVPPSAVVESETCTTRPSCSKPAGEHPKNPAFSLSCALCPPLPCLRAAVIHLGHVLTCSSGC
jgi:hypothetical protein